MSSEHLEKPCFKNTCHWFALSDDFLFVNHHWAAQRTSLLHIILVSCLHSDIFFREHGNQANSSFFTVSSPTFRVNYNTGLCEQGYQCMRSTLFRRIAAIDQTVLSLGSFYTHSRLGLSYWTKLLPTFFLNNSLGAIALNHINCLYSVIWSWKRIVTKAFSLCFYSVNKILYSWLWKRTVVLLLL